MNTTGQPENRYLTPPPCPYHGINMGAVTMFLMIARLSLILILHTGKVSDCLKRLPDIDRGRGAPRSSHIVTECMLHIRYPTALTSNIGAPGKGGRGAMVLC
uniref:Uncharacterized protein n=1 Tax=Pyxicephalus adspersus TaxID=30357 RepID=A0AAV2ZYY1_PYXAD|nr:TPA: hypothetical protein GDO54_004004 [Pyxicephalus adspersus]